MTPPGPPGHPAHRIRRLGEHGHLVECPSLADALACHAALTARLGDRPTDLVLGARTVAVLGPGITAAEVAAAAATSARDTETTERAAETATADVPDHGDEITLDVHYDGADLADLAAELDLSTGALVARHTGTPWIAAFAGFAPGFFYCVPTAAAPWPDVRRLDSPRTAVPRGSVAVAGGFSAVYPGESPGGWRLLGRTAAPMFDPTRDPPTLLSPGTRITYRAVRERVTALTPRSAPPVDAARPRALHVSSAGPRVLVQDRGRPGHAHLGVSSSGAADRTSAAAANALVGNDPDAAVLEIALGGLTLAARADHVVAVCGAPTAVSVQPTPYDDPADAPPGRAHVLAGGGQITVDGPAAGYVYLAVRGGIDVPPVLGSRSTDTLAALGPAPLSAGTVLPVGEPGRLAAAEPGPPATPAPPRHLDTRLTHHLTLRLTPGPRADAVTEAEWHRFLTGPWTVDARSDRVGIRLAGSPLQRSTTAELPSEAVVPGAVQVTGGGLPIVFLRDHPVTGGYPIVGVVVAADLDRLAQAPPGTLVRFASSPDRVSPAPPASSC